MATPAETIRSLELKINELMGQVKELTATYEEYQRLIPPSPECTEGDKKPGYVCSGGEWVSTMTTPGERRLYVKFDIPWLDLLPGIPYEPWMIIPPGFKVVEEP